ncbi:MAG: TraM recognition domain-containing protein [Pseudomonadota bacterium]
MLAHQSVSILGLAHRRYQLPQAFGIHLADRLLHLYILGQTGTGKSTLLFNLAVQDAQLGHGFCLIDPHGDLALQLHQSLSVPHLYWNAADPDCPLGYNPLQKVSATHRPLVASGLIDALKKQWAEAWGVRMEHLLRHALLALLEQPEADLRDIMRLFLYKGYRRQVIDRLTDPQLRFFWKEEFAQMNYQSSADGVTPIANKLGAFLAHPTVRTAVCEPAEPLRFRQIMDTGQILIVNLAKGRLGADVSNVLGGLMNAALTRHTLPDVTRRPFLLYVDEFHNLSTKSFADMLSEARKYGLGLILAHQHLSQTDKAVHEAILGNVGSMVVFRVGAADAPLLTRVLPPFTAHDLQNQPNHRAVIQLIQHGAQVGPFTASMYPASKAADINHSGIDTMTDADSGASHQSFRHHPVT